MRLESIASDEPDNAPGGADGNTTGDIRDAEFGTSDFSFRLRAERSLAGDGRIYTVVYSAEDEAGHRVTASALVRVPLNGRLQLQPFRR